jgi:SHS2 domain-containing protein
MRFNIKDHYQILEHDGDLGIIVRGEDLAQLFCHAGLAFFDIITDLNRVEAQRQKEICVNGQDLEELMINWLEELLYQFDTEGLLFSKLEVLTVDRNKLEVIGSGEPYDPAKHVINTIIKAATYHQLKVAQEGTRWQASIIFDL